MVRARARFDARERQGAGNRPPVSERFPVRNAKDVVHVLRRHEFVMVGQRGSHQKWRHPSGRQVIVPVHGDKPIPIGTLKSIIEGSGLTVDEFR